MITGDYERTAISIGKQIGIVRSSHVRVVTGWEILSIVSDVQEVKWRPWTMKL